MTIKMERAPVYMMHPLGDGSKREANRWLACQWQAAIQEAHPEWLVLAPWIGLSGAWSEAKRDLGLSIDFATIDLCHACVVAGPLTGPVDKLMLETGREVWVAGRKHSTAVDLKGISPGMGAEVDYAHSTCKPVIDLRSDFSIELPKDWLPKKVVESFTFRPQFELGEVVLLENLERVTCKIVHREERAPGVYYYHVDETHRRIVHEQSLRKL